METCYNICAHWPALGAPTTIHTSIAHHADPSGVLRPVVPKALAGRIKSKINASAPVSAWLARRAEAQGLAAVRAGDICYFWPGAQVETIAAAKARGGVIVLEFINTHIGHARRILAEECARIGAPPYDGISDADVAREQARLALADLIFAPGPFVSASIRAEAVTAEPIGAQFLETSYGTRLPRHARGPRTPGPLRFVFVGLSGIRKGVHLLLDAWKAAALPAELVIVGGVEPWLAARAAAHPQASVRFAGFSTDMAAVYADADVFVFPSLEEGGPQVTYEAAAHGLPLIVTGMGGGRIAVEGRNALIVPPSDTGALAQALRTLFEDAALRRRFGSQALIDAQDYQWPRVAAQRLHLLAAALRAPGVGEAPHG